MVVRPIVRPAAGNVAFAPTTQPSHRGGGIIDMSSVAFEALTEYNLNATYQVAGVGVYQGATLLRRSPWSYSVSDLHVSKSGNDSTGNGSFANPYLTIDKAISVASAAGGITIWVGAGTYAENSSTLGHLGPTNRQYTAPLVIRSVPGDEVILTNASGITGIRLYGTCSNITFRDLKIRTSAGGSVVVRIQGTVTVSNIRFYDCDFTDPNSNSTCFFAGPSTGTITNIEIKRCTFSSAGNFYNYFDKIVGMKFLGNRFTTTSNSTFSLLRLAVASGACYINSNTFTANSLTGSTYAITHETAATSILTLYINRNVIDSATSGINIVGGTSGVEATVYCDRNVIEAGGSGIRLVGAVTGGSCSFNRISESGTVGIGWPTDAAGLTVQGSSIVGNNINSAGVAGHALLIAVNSSSITAEENSCNAANGGRYGIVLKGDSHTIRNNVFYGGTTEGAYFKGATNCVFQNNVIYGTVAGSAALQFALDGAVEAADNEITDNEVIVTDGKLYDFTAAVIGDGNIVDRNTYRISGSGTWGSMFSTTVSSLANVRAAWAANYDVTTNDANSVEG